MKVTCVADLHGFMPCLCGGDLLILAGDYTATDRLKDWASFFAWLKRQSYKKKVLIAGNHDVFLEKGFPKTEEEAHYCREMEGFLLEENEDFEYLCDSGTEYEGLKIWGSPWTLKFKGMNPRCTAFTGTESELGQKFKLIPDDVDILVTHGPCYGIHDGTERGHIAGSRTLRNEIIKRIRPKLHVYGHIHEGYHSQDIMNGDRTYKSINCSHVNYWYHPVNATINIEL